MKLFKTLLFAIAFIVSSHAVSAEERLTVSVGVLKFGTVNWVLDVIKEHKLDEKHGVDLKVIPLGSKNATHVAVQGKAVNMIVSDWIWVTRQRAENRDYTFVPYSNAAGTLMVSPQSGINTLADLSGKKLGVAGGSIDKTWLLLRAYSQKKLNKDLADIVKPSFAAPPLLNKMALRGDLDGVLNFWHYTAKLKASNFKPLVNMSEVLKELGVERQIPVIGWVFSEKWANENQSTVNGFIAAAQEAQQLLIKSDAEWLRLKPKMKAKTEVMFNTLKLAFREGVPTCFGDEEINAARKTFAILATLGGKKLVGKSTELSEGTFWNNDQSSACGSKK